MPNRKELARPMKVGLGAQRCLLQKQKMAIRLISAGLSNTEIANKMGYHPQYISHLKAKEGVRNEVRVMEAKLDDITVRMQTKVRKAAVSGLDILEKILTPNTREFQEADIKTKARVAQDLLDREGSAPKISRTQQSGGQVHMHLTGDDIKELKAVAGGGSIATEPIDVSPKPKKPDSIIPEDLLGQAEA